MAQVPPGTSQTQDPKDQCVSKNLSFVLEQSSGIFTEIQKYHPTKYNFSISVSLLWIELCAPHVNMSKSDGFSSLLIC